MSEIRSEKEKQKLLKQFHKLKTIKEQFKFWDETLEHPYLVFLFLTSEYYFFDRTIPESEAIFPLEEFRINPRRDQFQEYNMKLIEQYKIHEKQVSAKTKMLNAKAWKERYERGLSISKNKQWYVDGKIKRINALIDDQERQARLDPTDKRPNYFMVGYEQKLYNDVEPDLTLEPYELNHLISLLNGNEAANLKVFFTNELASLQSKSKPKKQKEISLQQQILTLHFLGVFQKINKNTLTITDRVAFLASLLNKNSQTIKELYSKGDIYSLIDPEQRKKRQNIEKDLEKVHGLFLLLDLKEEAKQVKQEIDAL